MTMRRLQRYETDTPGLRHACGKSTALGFRGTLSLWTPPQSELPSPLPVMILLHGVYGCHHDWTASGQVHRSAAEMISAGELPPCALLMPSDGLWGDGSGYLAHPDADYERWIIDDCLEAARSLEPAITAESQVAIGGLSMGGYGALRLGCKYPERFTAITGHSSITTFDDMFLFVDHPRQSYGQGDGAHENVMHYACQHADRLPPLRFDCGVDDRLIASNRRLHAELDAAGIAHTYDEFPGAHSWDYWGEHVRRSLRFAGESW